MQKSSRPPVLGFILSVIMGLLLGYLYLVENSWWLRQEAMIAILQFMGGSFISFIIFLFVSSFIKSMKNEK